MRGLPSNQPRVTQWSPVGARWSLPQPAPDAIRGTRSGGAGASGRDPRASTRGRTPTSTRRGALHPLRGERQVRASPPETGEGSSGQPASGYAKLSPGGAGWDERLPGYTPDTTTAHPHAAPGEVMQRSPWRARNRPDPSHAGAALSLEHQSLQFLAAAKKSAQNRLSPARPLWGRAGERRFPPSPPRLASSPNAPGPPPVDVRA